MGWTCPECGLDYGTIGPGDIPVAIRSFPRRFRQAMVLADDEDEVVLRTRVEPGVWSALEYAAHVSDVFGAFADQFTGWLRTGEPTDAGWDPDERAREQRYNERDPEALLADLANNAEELADVFDRVALDQWSRVGRFPFGERDMLTMARNAVHEGKHHLRDVEHVLRQARGS